MEEEMPAVTMDEIRKMKIDIECNIQKAINSNFESLLLKSVPIKKIDNYNRTPFFGRKGD